MNAIKSFLTFRGINSIGNTLFKAVSLGSTMNQCNPLISQSFSSLTIKPLIFNCLNLKPSNFNLISLRGMKVKGKLKRRCKSCYFARIDGRMYILCDSYPRHKQMALVKREKYTWILSHCMTSKKRPY